LHESCATGQHLQDSNSNLPAALHELCHHLTLLPLLLLLLLLLVLLW
jgi:hypothetical protein